MTLIYSSEYTNDLIKSDYTKGPLLGVFLVC